MGCPIFRSNRFGQKKGWQCSRPREAVRWNAGPQLLIRAIFTLFLITLSAPCAAEERVDVHGFFAEKGTFPSSGVILFDPGTVRQSKRAGQGILFSRLTGPQVLCSAEESDNISADPDPFSDEYEDIDPIADPLEPLNRAFFHFNDKLYFWFLKPLATGYEKAVPKQLRIGVRNFFSNLTMPVRAVNCLLQGKVEGFVDELARFFINSSAGMLGFMDPAKQALNIEKQDEDFGQTLGSLGLGPGLFIDWPILGPSSLRDSIGWVGDGLLNPLNYAIDATKYNLAAKGYKGVNNTSLQLGEYESLKKAAVDPYISLRDAYHQYRQGKIRE